MKTFLFSLLLVPFLILASDARASVQIDDKIPGNMALSDQNGVTHSLDSLYHKKGLILVFVRSADWCPYCKKQLNDLNAIYPDIKQRGYELASISYDPVETLNVFSRSNNIAYKMLSDVGSETIKAFGILNTDIKPGARFYGVPNPQIYIVNTAGTVTHILSETNYQHRPSSADLLEALDSTE